VINYKIGFAQIKESQIRLEQSNENDAVEKRYMKIHRKMIAKDEEILNISILNNDLFIVTEQKIYKCLMVSNTNITR